MRVSIVLFIMIMSCGMFAQGKTTSSILDDELYKTFEKEALLFYLSDNYIEYKKITEELSIKLNGNKDLVILEKFEQWVKENLAKTKFDSIDEAMSLAKRRRDLFIENTKAQDSLYKKTIILKEKYGEEAYEQVFTERVLMKVVPYYLQQKIKI
ncbi:hypothetical protein HX001_02330 [Empedobacter brevis]|uniref:Peptidylprolyl isomerase n=1 Tax=Empedobacter brevis TaxID=247 RepID=A0AAJ1QC34_9FLAO|nr:hypothetical protein [Empedobacter brevis]MDM1071324.1 hypothetical protein [Empedobacter brevis]